MGGMEECGKVKISLSKQKVFNQTQLILKIG